MKRSKLLTIPRAATRMLLATLLLTMTAQTAWATDVTLSGGDNYTAQNGDALTGSTSGTVTIARNASITLNNATITGGIVCEGSATITLVGTNSVSGADKKAGIQIGGSGTTFTIEGAGSLTATGGGWGAGIGLSAIFNYDNNVSSGDIIIEGGTITAIGGNQGAGIGTGIIKNTNNDNSTSVQFGNVTIKGGTVTATDGGSGDGIGKGYSYPGPSITFGIVIIYDGIDMVDATSISESVTYMHDETDVTANASNYFTITEDGDRRIIAPKDDTDYTITIADDIEHGTLTGAATAKYMEKVTITATPDLGYRLSGLVVKDADNNDVATTGNSFFMPKGNVTVSAVFEEGTHGTTEFKLLYPTGPRPEDQAYETIYDGVTTVNLQRGRSYQILKYDNEYSYRTFLLDNSTYAATIPYSGGTGTFVQNGTNFNVDYNGESGFYDITMTDVGNDKWRVSIQKTVPVIDNIPDQTYTGSEIKPEPLVMAGSLSLTKGTDYEYSYTNNTNAGTAKVTVTFKGDYASLGSVEKEFTITPKIIVSNNAMRVTQDENGYYATFSGSANDAVSITEPITVKAVTLERSFANGKYSTMMLPFSLNANEQTGQTLTGANIYQFVGVEKINGQWIATMQTPTSPLQANTPYLVEPVTNDLTSEGYLTFGLNGGTVILQTSTSAEGSTNSDWQFVGTYTRLVYGTNLSGNVYGFASRDKTVDGVDVLAGEFVKAKDGAGVPPMRCYLTYKNGEEFTGASARGMTRGTAEEDLPQSIIVRLVGTNGETTNVMTLDTRTGEISTDGWYDMSGRKLDGKPTNKGLYINNGKKIVIK